MRVDVLAIGTELLLGQIVDTNSAWIGEQLAAAGLDTYDHRKVGDNQARMVGSLRDLLRGADAVIVCGGLGPTQDDVTRDAIAELMGVPLERHDDLVDHIASLFGGRGREMSANNLRQADVPVGGDVDPQPDRHRAGPAVRGGRPGRLGAEEGRLRRPRRAVRDAADDHRARPARPAGPVGRARGDRVAVAEDVGDVGVGPRRDDRRARRHADEPDDRVPRAGDRGALRATHREGGDRRRGACPARRRGGRAAADHRRADLRDRRPDDGVGGARPVHGAGLVVRRRRVAHRRPRRRTARERARREPCVPRARSRRTRRR